MSKHIISIFIFCIISIGVIAQPLREERYEDMVEAADEAYENGNYYFAAEYYEKAYKESRDKDLAIKAAKSHNMMRDYNRAERWFSRVLERDDIGLYNDYKYDYGMILKANGNYNESYKILNEFIAESSDEEKRKTAMLAIMGIEKSSEFNENLDAIIRIIGRKVNSNASESGPIPFGEDLYYSSLDRKDIYIEGEDSEGELYFKIYKSTLTDKGYDKGSALSEEINREGYHTSSPSISPDGSRMYFVRTLIDENEIIEQKIYFSKRKGNNWGAPDEVEGVNGDYFVTHPAIGELYGKTVLFFTAELDGGSGGKDIYYAESKGGDVFGSPINLGPKINSPYDEQTPYYVDGTLYFSSDGRPSMGGFDIYKTVWEGSGWSSVENMGQGYNSTYDDFFYSINEKGNQGFLVSNRPAEGKRSLLSKTCCDDIFSINIREMVIQLITNVEDENGPLEGAEVTLVDLSRGDDKQAPEVKTGVNSNIFSFSLDEEKAYKVVVKRDGYYPDSLEINTVGLIDDKTFNRTVILKPVPEPEPEVRIVTINEPIRLSKIYFDFDDDKILPDAEKDLSVLLGLLEQYPDMVIELSSHTDAQGVSSYNKKLSQRRANSTKNWLVERGIDPERIQAVGYGEEQILNRCENGVKCSDEEHRFNRRSEFKIIAGPTSIEIKKEVIETPSSGGMPMGSIQGEAPLTSIAWEKNNLDLGTVKMSEVVDFQFTFTNTGEHELHIKTVTSCHCTTFEYPTEPIKPGAEATIYASYDGSKKKNGPNQYREVINVICNTENVVEEAIFHVNVVK